jgi:hypothetical protein
MKVIAGAAILSTMASEAHERHIFTDTLLSESAAKVMSYLSVATIGLFVTSATLRVMIWAYDRSRRSAVIKDPRGRR